AALLAAFATQPAVAQAVRPGANGAPPVGVGGGAGPAGGGAVGVATGGGGTGSPGTRLPTGPVFDSFGEGLTGQPGGNGKGGLPAVQGPHSPDLICVVFRPGTPDATSSDFAQSLRLSIEKQYDLSGLRLRVFLMRIPEGANYDDTLRRAAGDKRPLWVQP